MVHLGLLRHVAPAKVRQPKALLLPQELLHNLFHPQQVSGLRELPRVSVITVAALKCTPLLAFHATVILNSCTRLQKTCTSQVLEQLHVAATSEGTNLDLRSRLSV